MKVYAAMTAVAASPAFGHLGHVNDTATTGHSHWLAVGATALTFAIAAFIWSRKRVSSISKAASTGDRLPENLRQ